MPGSCALKHPTVFDAEVSGYHLAVYTGVPLSYLKRRPVYLRGTHVSLDYDKRDRAASSVKSVRHLLKRPPWAGNIANLTGQYAVQFLKSPCKMGGVAKSPSVCNFADGSMGLTGIF